MNYIISGDSKEIAKVIQENRIRVQRGVIKFTPLADVESVPEKPEVDTKDVVETQTEDVINDIKDVVDDTKDVVEDDVKTAPEVDTKDVVEDDVKATKTTKRTKKSE